MTFTKCKSGFWLLLFSITVLMSSCKEKYKEIEPKAFNDKIRTNIHIKTTTDLVYSYDTTLVTRIAAKESHLAVNSKSIGDGRVEITAIVNIIDDDELKAEKIVMIAQHSGYFWHVFEIRYNWKNRGGHGHADWGI